ncbi:MAG TPA: GNAT family N-acetyltransferase [Pseudonocardiaceae bacterium]|nr:GNAT family N-acetyltransferase [Pseudonocardiaceae bacterium]
MTDDVPTAAEIRLLRPDEFRAANTLFRGSLHHSPATDEAWELRGVSYEEGRVYGAFRDDTLVGTALSYPGQLSVPGGELLPMAMVTAVGVRAGHTRRGVLTGLMRAQLTGITEPVATLRASESIIYGRFGYGVATRVRTVTVNRRRTTLRSGVPDAGSVRVLLLDEAVELLPALYDRVSVRRPGWSSRPAGWWNATRTWSAERKTHNVVAVHSGPDGDDGFVAYTVEYKDDQSVLAIHDFFFERPEVWGALWRFLMTVDLVDRVRGEFRPLDEPVEELVADRGQVKTSDVEDETWLRLADVPAALAARRFGELATGAGSVVVEVYDAFLPGNSGRYLIGDGPARKVTEPAALTLDVDVLAELYLGAIAPSILATAGRIGVVKADALPVADRLFAVSGSPWCGTFF